MKKDLKYFETEIKRITEEFEDYKKKHMGTPKPGKVVEISGMEWIILDKLPDGYFAILNSFYGKTRMFDSDSSNWKESSLRPANWAHQKYPRVSLRLQSLRRP